MSRFSNLVVIILLWAVYLFPTLNAAEISILGGIIEVKTDEKHIGSADEEIYAYECVDGRLLPSTVAESVETYVAEGGILIPVDTTIPVYEISHGRLVPLSKGGMRRAGEIPVYQIINGKLVLVKKYYIDRRHSRRRFSGSGDELSSSQDSVAGAVGEIIPQILEQIFGEEDDGSIEQVDPVVMDANPDNNNPDRVRLDGVVLEDEAVGIEEAERVDIAPIDRRDDASAGSNGMQLIPLQDDRDTTPVGDLRIVDDRVVRMEAEEEEGDDDSAGGLHRVDNRISPLPAADSSEDGIGSLRIVDDSVVRLITEEEEGDDDSAGGLHRVDNRISPLPAAESSEDGIGSLRIVDDRVVRLITEEEEGDDDSASGLHRADNTVKPSKGEDDGSASGIARFLEISRDSKVDPQPGKVSKLNGKLFKQNEVKKPVNSKLIIPDKKRLLLPSGQ